MRPSSLIVFLAGICWSSAAVAAPLDFGCSAPIGRKTEILYDRPGGAPFQIRGRISAVRLDRLPPNPHQEHGDTVTTPRRGAEVAVFDHDQGTSVKFLVEAGRQDETMDIRFVMSRNEQSEILLAETLAWRPHTGVSIPFDLSIEAARVVLRTGTREITAEIASGSDSQISIGCTGAEVDFQRLELGN